MTTTPKTPLRALRITHEQIQHVHIQPDPNNVEALQRSIPCDYFDVVCLDGDIDLFVDDEGAINGSPLNLYLTIVAHALGTPAVLFGTGIALGCNPNTGDTISLTDTQLSRINRVFQSKPDPKIVDRLAESLAPFPALVALLRRN
ncbi:DUF3846 domain-containing protein [Cryobacterium sp. MDB2-33-2]|uniref:DUF3846 domain-containing protein n=1 Tax=Cryobacterium sp. MDB2-33-2 TaxID=1259179 RepID=UPI00141AA963|nr:DUF3846 domain-containing protein [Cryobacterium sp. MDB2-33-2]